MQSQVKTNLASAKLLLKGARTFCIINEQDQPAAKEYNRKLYYRQKQKKLFLCVQEWDFVSDRSTTSVPKISSGFFEFSIRNGEKY